MPQVGHYARAMSMPLWEDSGFELPDDIELRRAGDLASLNIVGTQKVLGFVPSRFDKTAIDELIARLRTQQH